MSKKIKGKMVQEPPVPQTITEVLTVFNEINKVQSASKAHIFQLVRLFRADSQGFKSSFELAYLKIFKIFHQRGNRKMPPKYQQLASTFFQEILSKDSQGFASQLFNYFLSFLAEGIFSSLAGIRVTSGRMLFHLLKQGASSVDESARISVLRAVYYLLRLKVSTYKQIGIKLASLVLGWEHELKSKIQYEMFKILAVDENQQIRKLAITNVYLNQNNLDKVLLRLRDKSADIRSIVLKKLIGERYKLDDMSVGNRIHLLYDGYGNKEASIQQQTLRYFSKFFQNGIRRQSFTTFIQYFRPNLLLLYPHIYTLFDNLIANILQDMPISTISEFTQDSTNDLKQMSKNNMIRPNFREFIWLKNIGKSDRSEIKAIFEECVPSGLELSRILQQLMNGKDLFSLYQCLQIFSLQKSSDEMGRNKMFDSLKKAVQSLQFFEHQQTWQTLQSSDICPPLSEATIKQRKMMLSYFDLPLISNSYDLLYQLGNAMKALWPDHYEIQLKQIMAEWNDPEENTLIKEKQMAKATIQKLRTEGNTRLIVSFEEKINNIDLKLIKQAFKTRSIILILNRLRPTLSMQDFMPIIREDLGKHEQSQGLILLALYCLQEMDRVKSFLPLYWIHLNPAHQQRNKLHLMVSLKAITDFIVKFDLSEIKIGQQDEISYNTIIRKVEELVLDNDCDIRILAIEGLCRIIYHNRVPDDLLSSCFVRLLLLWWETGNEEVSAKSVHTISIFVKQYIERGPSQVRKLAQSLCIFFKVLLLKQEESKTISKLKITYNLKLQEFVKRAIVIAMTVLKYHKESRQVIWKYQQSGAELGPQEMFLLFLFKQEHLHYTIQKAINICDFYEDAPLQTIILIKKQVQILLESLNFGNRKNLQNMLKKLDKDLEQRIQIKNQQTFNSQLLQGLRSQLKQHEFLISNAAARLGQQLEGSQIFVKNQAIFSDIKAENNQNSEEEAIQGILDMIEQVHNVSSEQLPNKKKKKQFGLKRISEGIEEDDLMELKREEEEIKRKEKQEQNKRKNRKKAPPQAQEESISVSSKPIQPQQVAPIRTRSRRI